ncbi:MAG: M48 family metallopeptidase [candidate division Zixibacteria bacterium]|nr:M48 family metallopeptidase [candidate division Zixibacteria bacterium]
MTGTSRFLFILLGLITLLLACPLMAEENPQAGDTPTAEQAANSVDTTVSDSSSATAASVGDEPLYPMSPERKAKLISYSRFRNIWRFVDIFLSLGILLLILFTGFSARLRDWAAKAKNKFLVAWLFLILLLLTDYLLNLPFSIYRGFIVENNYGFLNQTFLQWWGEDLLGLLLLMIFAIIPVWFLYRLISERKLWWLWFSLGAIPFIVLVIVVVPVVISPMFNKFEPLKDKALETEILALADKAGIEGFDVFQVNASKQSDKINAYVTGMFCSKRIVLYDNMIKNFTTDEIKFVMGHEMGHYVMNHIWKGVGLAVIFIMLALWLTNMTIHRVIDRFRDRLGFDKLSDIASLPLLMVYLSIIGFIFNPLTNGLSRYHERQSDTYGMDISGVSGEAAAIAFDKLSVYNLSDPDPHPVIEFWFYSHPALKKRMEFVREYRP